MEPILAGKAESLFTYGWFPGRVPPHALSATLVLKATLDLVPGGTARPADELLHLNDEIFEDEDEEKSLRYPGDFALFKPCADVSLVGSCYAPGGKAATVLQVAFEVGSWKKSLAVIGNRTWGLAGMSQPEPFTKQPLRWEYSYGGEGYKMNPIGRGFEGRLLPNLEDPHRLMKSKKAPARPAGFAPIPRLWPRRWRNLGTYDGKWLREDWPWLPKDFDWQHFNAVGEDQQVKPFLRGDETIRVTHCHPDHPVYECRLPGWRPRWLVRRETEAGEAYSEARIHLDTLWVDMDAEQAVLVWRAVHPVSDRKLKDVTGHYIACERIGDDPAPKAEHELRFREGLAKLAPPPPPEEEEETSEEEAALTAGETERLAFDTAHLDRDERLREYIVKRGEAHEGALDVLIREEKGKLGFLGPVMAYYDGLEKL
ncbi:MAG: DUF2169 family type VI secretion system accessory protein, partial [Planctomycetota bacterium]